MLGVDELLDKLNCAKVFSKISLRSRYYQNPFDSKTGKTLLSKLTMDIINSK